jgi:hypothetical protein
MFDDFPIERPGQDRLKVGVFFRFPLFRSLEPLLFEVLQAGQKRKAQQVAERKTHFALPVGVQVLLFHVHLGVVAQNPLEHGGHIVSGD